MPRVGVVGATGAVGSVTLELLAARGFDDVRAFASARSAGSRVRFEARELEVEEATPEALSAGDLDLCFFSVGTATSRKLVPYAVAGGSVALDKSDAYRLTDGVPLVVAGVNDDALDGIELPPPRPQTSGPIGIPPPHPLTPGPIGIPPPHPLTPGTGSIVANPNCSAMQLTCALKPLHEAAGLARVRLATYQAMSGKGDAGIEELNALRPAEGDLGMDWDLVGEEFSEEWKLRAETRKILGLPDLLLSATCVRVPVLVGHAQAVWLETEDPLSPEQARKVLAVAPHVSLVELPTPGDAAGRDDVLVGRIRRDPTAQNGLVLWVVGDNLRKGAALNAVQIAELMLERRLLPA